MATATLEVTRQFTATALDAELSRRKNNKAREAAGEPRARSKGFVLPSLTKDDVKALKAGELVTKTYKSGRVEVIGIKS